MERKNTQSWGRLTRANNAVIDYDEIALDSEAGMRLPFGNGRSYGDSCHNKRGILIDARAHAKILDFNQQDGVLTAQSGTMLSEILQLLVGTEWFLPVVPGTKFVTLGGAIANDIHGKNHGHRGTFGRHVRRLVIKRSGKREMACTPNMNHEMFEATVGGLGLTGFIVSAEIQLAPVPSHYIRETKKAFSSLDEYLDLAEEAEEASEYSVAWVDSLAKGSSVGRGILITGNHAPCLKSARYGEPKITVPFVPPQPLVSGPPLRAFNWAYYKKGARTAEPAIVNPNSFFFPLDAIGHWNRLYGPLGLYQHQSVLPFYTAPDALKAMLEASQLAGHGSFLTVLKRFGDKPSPGLMSFPMPGYTLTLDFPNRGEKTIELLDELDRITQHAGGRVNPYKDAHMSAETFQAGFPHWEQLERMRDRAITSDFWKRVTKRKTLAPPPLETPDVNQAPKPAIQTNRLKSRTTQ